MNLKKQNRFRFLWDSKGRITKDGDTTQNKKLYCH